MASSSGTSLGSGSYTFQNSGSEEDVRRLMDQRKRKRMISNRESARRSRMRKQKHLDDLMSQLAHHRKENNQILTTMNVTTQHYLNVEAENSILRAQVVELSNRFQSLTQIISFFIANNSGNTQIEYMADGFLMNDSWNYLYSNQPIITADILQY
ncbi:bZIP transcription factor 44-like [Nicotiana tabacum]|uniref:BZIP transcription factor 53-like n=1 Tax=Nicotiana tabacum TaxID=4097 RepID=A0A1S3ZBT0_TOBAC|nr:PREDICTED: bZIP transcription factor 53-like [Nicotiana tabacum]XP_033516730.1 bZIP transcription factor 11-like [Nicotiana tomentosiformis]